MTPFLRRRGQICQKGGRLCWIKKNPFFFKKGVVKISGAMGTRSQVLWGVQAARRRCILRRSAKRPIQTKRVRLTRKVSRSGPEMRASLRQPSGRRRQLQKARETRHLLRLSRRNQHRLMLGAMLRQRPRRPMRLLRHPQRRSRRQQHQHRMSK